MSLLTPDVRNDPLPSACHTAGERSTISVCAQPAATSPLPDTTVARLLGGFGLSGNGAPSNSSGCAVQVPPASLKRMALVLQPFQSKPTMVWPSWLMSQAPPTFASHPPANVLGMETQSVASDQTPVTAGSL